MSGGHWDYLQTRFDEAVEGTAILRASLTLLGQIEHELDWGHSCDTCLTCARRRVLLALDVFFDGRGLAEQPALAVLRDRENAGTWCDQCLSRVGTMGRREGARPTVAECQREIAQRAAATR